MCKSTAGCRQCEGSGLVISPVWEQMFSAYREQGLELLTEDQVEQWARDNGYESLDDMGPEELPCSCCQGSPV